MKKCLNITASIDKPELVEYMAESLASKLFDSGNPEIEVPNGWRAIKTSSVESYVSGNVEMQIEGEPELRIPFKTCFIFSCTKEKDDPYKLDWGMSFS